MGSFEPATIQRKLLRRMLDLYPERRARDLFRRHVRPTDVFLVGHPKSGNTWLAYMLAIVLQKERAHGVTMANPKEFIPVVHGRDHHIALYRRLPCPRIFRNEWPVFPELYPKTLYILRDPRSVLVSYFHHYLMATQDRTMTIESFVEEYLTYGCIRRFGPLQVRWDRQVNAWRQRALRQPVLQVRYEDMVRDRERVLKEVLAFSQVPYSDSDVQRAVERGSFEAMRRDEERHGAESFVGRRTAQGRFLREGKVDGWRSDLPASSRQAIESAFGPVMNAYGYA